MGAKGGCEVVAGVFRRFPSDAWVLEAALLAVEKLAVSDTNARRLSTAGVCESIVETMAAFPRNRHVMYGSFRAIVSGGDSWEGGRDTCTVVIRRS
jgi:cytidylate kinase